MKDNASFQACDFSCAVQIEETGTLPSDFRYVDYPFDFDSLGKMHYFASYNGCLEGQKVAIMPTAEYTSTYDMCFTMGANDRANRIQHCDCDGSKYRIKLGEVCHSGYVDGCHSQQPDDLSCCNPDTYALGYMNYVHGGNCIPKNQLEDMLNVSSGIWRKCTDGGTPNNQCDDYKTGDCPWWREGGPYSGYTYNTMDDPIDGPNTTFDPFCEPWYMIAHCADLEAGLEVGAGFTCTDCNVTATLAKIKADIHTDSCRSSQEVAAWKMYLATDPTWSPDPTTSSPDPTTSSPDPTTSSPDPTTSSPASTSPATEAPVAEINSLTVLSSIGFTLAILA